MVELLPVEQFLMLKVTSFLLIVTRVSGLFIFSPLFSSNSLPGVFRVYTTIAISVLMTPIVTARSTEMNSLVGLVVAILGELLIGLILGTALQMIFQGLQLAGQTAGTQLGLALANVVNPQFDEQTSTTAVVYVTVASLAFLGIGAHRELIAALLETFAVLPLGEVWFHNSSYHLILQVFQESMVFAIRVAAPVTVALLLAEISMGFIGKTVPQLNILSIGFSVRILLGIAVTTASLFAATEVFQDYIGLALSYGYEMLANMVEMVLQHQNAGG